MRINNITSYQPIRFSSTERQQKREARIALAGCGLALAMIVGSMVFPKQTEVVVKTVQGWCKKLPPYKK